MVPSPRAFASYLVTACLMAALFGTLACTNRPTPQGGFAISEDAYYREIKGWVAAVEYAFDEKLPGYCGSNVRQVGQVLDNSVEEDVTGYEGTLEQLDKLVNQLEVIFDSGEGPEKAAPLVAELVRVAETLPGPTMTWDAYWEGPGE